MSREKKKTLFLPQQNAVRKERKRIGEGAETKKTDESVTSRAPSSNQEKPASGTYLTAQFAGFSLCMEMLVFVLAHKIHIGSFIRSSSRLAGACD